MNLLVLDKPGGRVIDLHETHVIDEFSRFALVVATTDEEKDFRSSWSVLKSTRLSLWLRNWRHAWDREQRSIPSTVTTSSLPCTLWTLGVPPPRPSGSNKWTGSSATVSSGCGSNSSPQ